MDPEQRLNLTMMTAFALQGILAGAEQGVTPPPAHLIAERAVKLAVETMAHLTKVMADAPA